MTRDLRPENKGFKILKYIYHSIMCGIAGVYYFNKEETGHQVLPDVLKSLRHRGPDYQNAVQAGACQLYHSRLSIVDTSAGSHQPFSEEGSGRYLVYNGEIFNYSALAQPLSGLKTSGDVEVLYKLLASSGLTCLNSLNGFFAFAHYDAQTHRLWLARDRFGVKPLYYYSDGSKLAFASELKPLLDLCGKQPLNTAALYSYLRLNYISGPQTIFQNVYRLMPGECMEVQHNKIEKRYWYHCEPKAAGTDFGSLLSDAVKLRLHADVPVGTFLSGGLDSSIVSALAKQHKPDLHTFSIGFENASYFDETRYSEMVAQHIGSNHHVFKLKPSDFTHHLQDFLNAVDEPFADSSAFNFYLLSKYTAGHVKVALSGDGADELFKGYHKHKALYLNGKGTYRLASQWIAPLAAIAGSSRHGRIANSLRQMEKFSRLSGMTPEEAIRFLACISDHDQVKALMKRATEDSAFQSLFKVNPVFNGIDLETSFDLQSVLTDDMLVKADRFSMQHGIEIRNPFLDYRVVEFALQLPPEAKISGRGQKLILKDSFRHLLPKAIFERKKKGFELPLQQWLKDLLLEKGSWNVLGTEQMRSAALLNPAEVQKLLTALHSERAGDSAARLWAVLVLEAWLTNFESYIAD